MGYYDDPESVERWMEMAEEDSLYVVVRGGAEVKPRNPSDMRFPRWCISDGRKASAEQTRAEQTRFESARPARES